MGRSYLNYFNSPLSVEAAHMIGFIAADGNIYYKGNRGSVKIAIADRDTLEIFLKRMNCKNKIHTVRQEKIFLQNGNVHYHKPIYQLCFSFMRLCDVLQRNGIHVAKSLSTTPRLSKPYKVTDKPGKLEPPPFKKKDLVLSYICGFFEGDGCLSWVNKKKYKGRQYQTWTITFTGSYIMMLWVSEQLDKFGIAKFKKPVKSKTTYQLQYLNQQDINSIIMTLRQIGTCTMPRKWHPESYRKYRDEQYNHMLELAPLGNFNIRRYQPTNVFPGNEDKFRNF